MDWTEIVVALIAGAGGFIGAIVSNNRQLAVLSTKLDGLKEDLAQQGRRIDAHNHLSERISRLEALAELQKSGGGGT